MASLFSQFGESQNQYQRDANLLEKVINAIQVPTQAVAGAVNYGISGLNPLEGAKNYVELHKDFTHVLRERGVEGLPGAGLGLIANIALDPLSYVGMGQLTAAGKLARAADVAGDAGKALKSMDMMHDAAKVMDDVGSYSMKWSEQAASKQRAMVTFAGKPVLYGDKVYAISEKVSEYVGNSTVGKTLDAVFGNLKSKVPEWAKLRNIGRKAAMAKRGQKLGEELSEESLAYYDAMKLGGLEATDARDILRDTIELSKPKIDRTDLTEYMSDKEFLAYTRWTWNAEAGRRNAPMQMFRNKHEDDMIQEAFPGRRRRPNAPSTRVETTGSELMEGVTDVATGPAAARGRKLSRTDKIAMVQLDMVDKDGLVIKRGKSGKHFVDTTGLGTPNFFGLADSWDFTGRMPDHLTEVYEKMGQKNTVKAIRRIEEKASERYVMAHLANTIHGVGQKYGVADMAGLSAPLMRAVGYVNMANASFIGAERAAGLTINELVGDFNYLKRVMTPEGRDAYIAATEQLTSQSSAYDVSARFAAQLKRDDFLRNLTLSEVNQLSLDGKLTILTGGKKVKLFEDEPFFATFVRGTESHRAIESANMTMDAINVYGKEILGTTDKPVHLTLDAPQGHAFLMNRLAEDLGIRQYKNGLLVRDVALPQDIVNLLNMHYERVLAPAGLQPALRGYDALQRMWKNLTLPIWPAYQTRNGLSDLIMITHAADDYGLSMPEAFSAIKDSSYGLAGKLDSISIGDSVVSWDEYTALMDKFGIKDYSPGRELDDLILRPKGLKNFRKGILGFEERFSSSKPFELGIRAGQWRQNATNSGYFLGLLRRGVSPEIAALEVKKRLFDFQDLTATEKQVLRRIFPFYSWLRHNIPYQINAMVARPRILTEIGWLREAASEGEGPAGDVMLPSFLAQGLPVSTGGSDRKPTFARLKGLIPQADILGLSNPLQEAGNAVSPFLKVPLEMTGNYKVFQRQQLERYPGETAPRFGVNMSRRYVNPVIDMVRPLSEVNNMFFRDQPLADKIQGFIIAKDYSVDSDLQQRLASFKLQEEDIRVRKMMYQAAAKGDSGSIIRLRKYLQDVHRNPSQLLK